MHAAAAVRVNLPFRLIRMLVAPRALVVFVLVLVFEIVLVVVDLLVVEIIVVRVDEKAVGAETSGQALTR